MEIKKIKNENYLILKDKCIEITYLQNEDDEKAHYLNADYLIEDDRLCRFEDVADISLNDLPISLCFNLYFQNTIYQPLFNILIVRKLDIVEFKAHISYNLEEWQEDISAKKLTDILYMRINELNIIDISEPEIEISSIFLTVSKKIDINKTLRQEAEYLCEIFSSVEKEILSNYKVLSGITAKINVDPKYSHIFAQYVMYFGQFLSDMGIEADTNVSNNNGAILLTVNPTNKDDAIQKIYVALNSYLSLADGESAIKPNSHPLSELKYAQLLNNVEHLKSQLSYTQAILEVKNEHIEILRREQEFSRIYTINQHSPTPEIVAEKWEPIDGISITKYDGGFFEIDIPKIIKKIAKKLSRNT